MDNRLRQLERRALQGDDQAAHAWANRVDLETAEALLMEGRADWDYQDREAPNPWWNLYVRGWVNAVGRWVEAHPGCLMDRSPSWDGRSLWSNMAEWHRQARGYALRDLARQGSSVL